MRNKRSINRRRPQSSTRQLRVHTTARSRAYDTSQRPSQAQSQDFRERNSLAYENNSANFQNNSASFQNSSGNFPSNSAGFQASSVSQPTNSASHQTNAVSVGQLRRERQRERLLEKSRQKRKRLYILIAVIAIVVGVLAGWAALYNSSAFTIENVEVNGVEHLTKDEMSQLAHVPDNTTLLRVDIPTIEARLKQNAWVSDVHIDRVFPNTLQINVTERVVFAIVEIPTTTKAQVKQWAIAQDHMWLMPIPEEGSDAANKTSSKIYEDAASALHISDVPFDTKAEIAKTCTDANVSNALDIVNGLTTELAGRVVKVSAPGIAETTLELDNGVEVAFGKAEDIREKERVILEILAENPDSVSYINVRIVGSPTWRSLD